jgi:Icc-related predicted phosphoesterase
MVQSLISAIGRSGRENRVIIVAGDMGIKATSKYYTQDVNHILSSLSVVCKHLFYLPGDTDEKGLEATGTNAKNLDKKNYIIEVEDVKLGLLGLGGAPAHSVRRDEPITYLWDESIPFVAEGLSTELKINIEKVMHGRPDYIILVTHSPPYGISDRSTPITYKEMIALDDLLEELRYEGKAEEKEAAKKVPRGPRHLGSRLLREFVKYYKPDIHIFGHVHKEGGRAELDSEVKFFNVSHLSPLPYRLTGRKFLTMKLTKENISASFNHLVRNDLPFHEFIEKYL